MKKQIIFGMIIVITFILIGCNGVDGNGTTTIIGVTPSNSNGLKSLLVDNTNTGTGFYVDNAVKGINFTCGKKSGVTDKDGKFTFEKGKDCKFTLAGIPLRTTKSDDLVEGKKILEDNPQVARLLQSIDSDGDLSNGIQITDEVIKALRKALVKAQSVGKLPSANTLIEVVANIGYDIEGVNGDLRTEIEVKNHLDNTKKEITKSLLAGKTLYYTNFTISYTKDINSGKDKIKNIIYSFGIFKVSNDLLTIELIDSKGKSFIFNDAIIKDGNKLIFNKLILVFSQKNGYLLAKTYDSDNKKIDINRLDIEDRFYSSKEGIEAYIKLLKKKNSKTINKNNLDLHITEKELSPQTLAGKSFYSIGRTVSVGNDLKKITIYTLVKIYINKSLTEIKSDDNSILPIKIKGNKFYIYNNYFIFYQKNDYILTILYDFDGKSLINKTEVENRIYPLESEVKAQAYIDLLNKHTSTLLLNKKILAGNTFYGVYDNKPDVGIFKISFNNDLTSINNNSIIKLIDNKLYFKNSKDGSYFLLIENKNYIFSKSIDSKGLENKILNHRLYSSQSQAEAYLELLKKSNPIIINKLLVGKTYYVPVKDSYKDAKGNMINNDHVENIIFSKDGKTLNITWKENGKTKNKIVTYNVYNNILTIEEIKIGIITSNTNGSLSVGTKMKLFNTFQKAIVALELL